MFALLTRVGFQIVEHVSPDEQIQALADKAYEEYGAVDVLCNNAGVFAGGLSWEAPSTDWEWVLGVNTYGVLNGVRAFVPTMLAQNEPGHIVNTVSMALCTR